MKGVRASRAQAQGAQATCARSTTRSFRSGGITLPVLERQVDGFVKAAAKRR